jgi:hypothetical protein
MAARQGKEPMKAAARRSRSQRRVGDDAACVCGEMRPEALIQGRQPTVCYKCDAKQRGKSTFEVHEVAGRANDPTAITIPINDHRAELSVDQYDWPQRTLQNPDRSPLLAMSGCIRGFMATTYYLMERLLGWIPPQLETLDAFLCEQWGSQWWLKVPLRQLPPK